MRAFLSYIKKITYFSRVGFRGVQGGGDCPQNKKYSKISVLPLTKKIIKKALINTAFSVNIYLLYQYL